MKPRIRFSLRTLLLIPVCFGFFYLLSEITLATLPFIESASVFFISFIPLLCCIPFLFGLLVMRRWRESGICLFCMFMCLAFAVVARGTPEFHLWVDGWQANQLDDRVAEAQKHSDAAAVTLLQKMLREKTFERERAMVRLYRLKFAPEAVAIASPELVSILEEDGGAIIGLAVEELRRIGPLIPDDQVPRLVNLAKCGDPDWRRKRAMNVLISTGVDDPDVAAAIHEVQRSNAFRSSLTVKPIQSQAGASSTEVPRKPDNPNDRNVTERLQDDEPSRAPKDGLRGS